MIVSAIIQARMGSTRLPGKVLKKLNSVTSLEFLMEQLSFSKLLKHKIIATSTNSEDDAIFDLAKTNHYEIYRGESLDVLDRYYQCAKEYGLKHIVRITADNPLIDPEIVDLTINEYMKTNLKYVSNCLIRTFPYGTEVEVFSFDALEKAWHHAKLPDEREHVTTYIINHPKEFTSKCIQSKTNLSHLRWTVDKNEDFNFVKSVYSKILKRPILLSDILKVIERYPHLLELNKKSL